jgi:protein phosphatase
MELLRIAKEAKKRAILLVFDVNLGECIRRDALREQPVGRIVIYAQGAKLRQAMHDIQTEEWDEVIFMKSKAGEDNIQVRLGPFDLRYERGPFDIIGDVHGCTDELLELMSALGYTLDDSWNIEHPDKRKLVFLGDLGDRGPHNVEAFTLVMQWVRSGNAFYTPGNHCNKLMRYLKGRNVTQSHGLELTVAEVEAQERQKPGFKAQLHEFISEAPTYLWLDSGKLVVAHGGIKRGMIGRDDRSVQTMCLYGDITGKSNPDGTPVRLDWAANYHGEAAIVYGHTPTPAPEWRNNTINIDQGCVFGGHLTALRWPEREIVQVKARATYDPSKDIDPGP